MPQIQQRKIFIVESQYIVAADLAIHLTEFGYKHIDIFNKYEDIARAIGYRQPYLIIVSMALFDKNDGVILAQKIDENFQVPIAFMTESVDPETFLLAMNMKPHALFLKPFDRLNVQRGLEHVSDRILCDSLQN